MIFVYRLNKILEYPKHNTGFYTDDIELTKDLKHWLKQHNIYDTCTHTIHVLKGNKMIEKTYLKDFIASEDVKYV